MKGEEKSKKTAGGARVGRTATADAAGMMRTASHSALYRKYRPATFADVLGQEQVVKALEGAIGAGKVGSNAPRPHIAHAYLFSGSRGTGKTSVARIFAQAIGTSANDLYEIDAASNRGIDDVRELREAVNTLPFESPYKVYIIDEVHMLTKEAFNALLKTLEEPPAHVVFILATTDSEKLPQTVVSRCQTFVFRKPTNELLKKMVLKVAKAEGFTLEPASAELIALLGDGSYRDTHGVLQKVLGGASGVVSGDGESGAKTGAGGAKNISVESVERITGAPQGALVNTLLSALEEGSAERAIDAIQAAKQQNVDVAVFARLLLYKLRFVLLMRMSAEMRKVAEAEFSEADFAVLSELAKKPGAKLGSRMLSELLVAADQIGRSPIPELPLELAVMRIVGER